MELRHWMMMAGMVAAAGCGPLEPEPREPAGALEATVAAVTQQGTVQLNILYVHGVKGCQDHRLNAENSLNELDDALAAALPQYIADYQASHPGVTLVVRRAH